MSGLPGGIANGPSRIDHLEKDAQLWERPWTLEEMRQSGANWSLAADSGLFLFLQDFSQRMLSKTHEIEKQLDSLISDTKATDSCLHSVFNDFLMLSNTQFIENRVYDEEVVETLKPDGLEKQPEQEKTREQKEAELIPKMQEAVNYGLRVLESAFEHLDIKAGNSDSEDEEVPDKVEAILEPKDLYVDRPLPYLIGSQAFMEQDDVGLGDLSSDEVSVDSDREIESDDGKESVHSDDDFDQEDEGQNIIAKKSSMLSYEDDEEEEEDSDIFGDSDRDDEDDDTRKTGPSSFADELAARIKGETVSRAEGDRASLASKKKNKGKKEPKAAKPQAEDDNDDMFKPPKLEDEDFSPFGGKSGLFSGGRGLFDDDDEGDLFSEAPKPPVSEERKVRKESLKSTDSDKPGKKILAGAISVFPDNHLFSTGNDSDSVGSKENGAPATPRQTPAGASAGGGGGLFEDEDDDDFFSGKSLKKSAEQEKVKPKKPIDLFADDDEDGDIFSEKYSAPTTSKKEAEKPQTKQPEKKVPVGAISLFGPGTKSLLSEGLKKRQPSTSEESNKSEENGPAPEAVKATVKPPQKPPVRGLFSDDEDSQEFPAIPKSQSKPELSSQSKTSKTALSLFDDEEEDLFASAVKSNPKSNQAKATTPQPSKTVSSSLFSDDEDQWLSSKSSVGKPEVKTGGIKPSASAPSGLPGANTSHKSLFDDGDDDLFAPPKESSQKKPQKVSLLFEDEDDDFNGSLFGNKPAANTSTAMAPANKPAVGSELPTQSEKSEEVVVSKTPLEDKPSEQTKPAVKTPEPVPASASPESTEGKKKPAGAVSLFGGIDVFGNKQAKSPLDKADDDDGPSKSSPPPIVKKEEKVKKNALSLFDDEEEDDSDWNEPIFAPSKPTDKNTATPAEEKQQAKSTGVFQDEELLFSQSQQKDNDPDVDLFSTPGKAASSKLSSTVKPAALSLFSDDDEDDLFSSVKPKDPPPKVAEKNSKPNDKASPESPSEVQKPAPSPVKPKDSSSRIGKLQANLVINPAALLPGAVPTLPGATSVLPSTAPNSSSEVSISRPTSTTLAAQADVVDGVSFDVPVQVTTLQSAHKTRAKVAAQRRPQSRAARQQAAQRSVADEEHNKSSDVSRSSSSQTGLVLPLPHKNSQATTSPTPETSAASSAASSALPAASPPTASLPEAVPRPLVLTLPESKNAVKKDSSKDSSSSKVLPPSDEYDIFATDSLFGATSASSASSTRQTAKTSQPQVANDLSSKKDKSTLPSIFDDDTDDLFQKAKPRSKKEVKASPFPDEDDDDEDIFGFSSSSTPTSTSSKETGSNVSKQDIFQDEVATVPKVHKKHKTTIDVSLFDDNFDIFADLTDNVQPKQKSKIKGETKSIFDDDMDDIFATTTVKTVPKPPSKSKKTPPAQESSTAADSSNIFDDPLNAFGGN